jgi:hypothetical protein
MDTLRSIHMDDLLRFKWSPGDRTESPTSSSNGVNGGNNGNPSEGPEGGGNWGYHRGYGFRGPRQ